LVGPNNVWERGTFLGDGRLAERKDDNIFRKIEGLLLLKIFLGKSGWQEDKKFSGNIFGDVRLAIIIRKGNIFRECFLGRWKGRMKEVLVSGRDGKMTGIKNVKFFDLSKERLAEKGKATSSPFVEIGG
jgi:hypothetical protein